MGQHLDRSLARLRRTFAGESLIGLSPVAADCWDRFDAMAEKGESRDLPEPFEVPWTEGIRELRPSVRPEPNAPLLMRLNRNPFGLDFPWIRREEYRQGLQAREDRVAFSTGREDARRMRTRPAFSSPAEDRFVLAAPPTLRARIQR